MRLIDADALQRFVIELTTEKGLSIIHAVFETTIQNAPTIDAVPVVRCKDCKYRGNSFACPMCHDESIYDDDDGYDNYTYDRTDDDSFCDKGERWDEDEVD